ncbi:extracellular solute-binding protein [Ruania alba]|uniref:extracellular solute-binding protein n=1 Tax=Ruania alba TaxID=648782 RepID=UPI000B7CAC2C
MPFDDYQTRFRTLIAGGSPPDLMRLNDDFLREMSDKESILDIEPYLSESGVDTSDYFEGVLDFTALPNGRAAWPSERCPSHLLQQDAVRGEGRTAPAYVLDI